MINIDKPILLVREEFINNIIELINGSKLPLVLIEPVLEKILNDTRSGLKNQYEKERKEYETYLLNKNIKNKINEENDNDVMDDKTE